MMMGRAAILLPRISGPRRARAVMGDMVARTAAGTEDMVDMVVTAATVVAMVEMAAAAAVAAGAVHNFVELK